jgi:hypothetical protein
MEIAKSIVLIQEEPRGPSQLVEIPVTVAGINKVVLPDVQQLRSQVGQVVVICAIRLITDQQLTNAPLGGQITAPLGELQKISLTLYCEGWEKGQLIPLLTLCDVFIEASGIGFRPKTARFDDWKNVDWSKSYLQYSNGTVSAGTPYAVLLEVEYKKFDSKGNQIFGAQ